MIGTLLRAAGGAASFTLGSLWPMRWPAFPVSFFDFDMFNEPADALWAEAKERCAREARDLEAQARELAAQTAIPQTVYPSEPSAAAPGAPLNIALDAMMAAHSGDLARAFALAEQFQKQAGPAISGAVGRVLLDASSDSSSAAGEAGDIAHRGPTAEDGPALGSLPPEASAGQPNFTAGELEDAAYAVRRHITDRVEPASEIGAEAWTHLAEKLEAAAVSK